MLLPVPRNGFQNHPQGLVREASSHSSHGVVAVFPALIARAGLIIYSTKDHELSLRSVRIISSTESMACVRQNFMVGNLCPYGLARASHLVPANPVPFSFVFFQKRSDSKAQGGFQGCPPELSFDLQVDPLNPRTPAVNVAWECKVWNSVRN